MTRRLTERRSYRYMWLNPSMRTKGNHLWIHSRNPFRRLGIRDTWIFLT